MKKLFLFISSAVILASFTGCSTEETSLNDDDSLNGNVIYISPADPTEPVYVTAADSVNPNL